MGSLRASLPAYLHTPRLTLELFNYSAAHYDCCLSALVGNPEYSLLRCHNLFLFSPASSFVPSYRLSDFPQNSPTAIAHLGDLGLREAVGFDASNHRKRLFPQSVGGKSIDIDVFYLLCLGDKTGALMGAVSLMQRASSMPPDVGYCLLEEYHEQGYASEAARELLRCAREELGIREIMTSAAVTNRQSWRIAEKIGFFQAGRVEKEDGSSKIVYVLPGMDADKVMEVAKSYV